MASLTAQLASPSGPQQAEHQLSASAGTSYPGGAYSSRPMVCQAYQACRACSYAIAAWHCAWSGSVVACLHASRSPGSHQGDLLHALAAAVAQAEANACSLLHACHGRPVPLMESASGPTCTALIARPAQMLSSACCCTITMVIVPRLHLLIHTSLDPLGCCVQSQTLYLLGGISPSETSDCLSSVDAYSASKHTWHTNCLQVCTTTRLLCFCFCLSFVLSVCSRALPGSYCLPDPASAQP